MPGSSPNGKAIISSWFVNIPNKKTILDVGAGWGTYIKLLREQGQIWHAVEIHEPYINMFNLDMLYDEIFIEDIRLYTPTEHYDVIICGDVLEHINNEDALRVLEKMFRYSKYIIVSLPLDAETNAPQGTCHLYWNNPYELHVGKWSHQQFVKAINNLGGIILAHQKYPEIAVYLLTGDANQLSDEVGKLFGMRLGN